MLFTSLFGFRSEYLYRDHISFTVMIFNRSFMWSLRILLGNMSDLPERPELPHPTLTLFPRLLLSLRPGPFGHFLPRILGLTLLVLRG